MLEVLKVYPRIFGTFFGIAIGTVINGSIGGTMTLVSGLSAVSLYALAAVRRWF